MMDEAMTCDARIRAFIPVNDTEVACDLSGDHARHKGILRDYAWPGSETVVEWLEDDRRNFHGEWPGSCPSTGCTLPSGHRGNHAT